jgi:hypothetical protein
LPTSQPLFVELKSSQNAAAVQPLAPDEVVGVEGGAVVDGGTEVVVGAEVLGRGVGCGEVLGAAPLPEPEPAVSDAQPLVARRQVVTATSAGSTRIGIERM